MPGTINIVSSMPAAELARQLRVAQATDNNTYS